MQYAIELYFDTKTEEKLWELPRQIAAEHISSKYLEWKTRPHLTLACFNNVNEMQCIEQLKAFADRHNTMPAHICSVGMFPDTKTIFVSSVMNVRIYQFHQELHESLKNFDTKGWEWYCPDTWAPHCTGKTYISSRRTVYCEIKEAVKLQIRKYQSAKTLVIAKIRSKAASLDKLCL